MKKCTFIAMLALSSVFGYGQQKISAMLSPNPADQFCKVSISEAAEVRLLDLQGNMHYQSGRAKEVEMDLRGLPEGIYFVHLVGRTGVQTMRLIHRSRD